MVPARLPGRLQVSRARAWGRPVAGWRGARLSVADILGHHVDPVMAVAEFVGQDGPGRSAASEAMRRPWAVTDAAGSR